MSKTKQEKPKLVLQKLFEKWMMIVTGVKEMMPSDKPDSEVCRKGMIAFATCAGKTTKDEPRLVICYVQFDDEGNVRNITPLASLMTAKDYDRLAPPSDSWMNITTFMLGKTLARAEDVGGDLSKLTPDHWDSTGPDADFEMFVAKLTAPHELN